MQWYAWYGQLQVIHHTPLMTIVFQHTLRLLFGSAHAYCKQGYFRPV